MEPQADELSLALKQMQDSLRKVSDEHAERIWLQSGKNALTEKLRGDLPLRQVAQNVTDCLASLCEAQLGALYSLEKDAFGLQYAHGLKMPPTTLFRPGEGLAGQAAAEKRLMVIENLPPDYFYIESSLGRHTPRAVAIVPAVFEGRVLAVIELGKFGTFTPLQLKLLEEITVPVAITVNSLLVKKDLEDLITRLDGKEKELNSRITAINRSNAAVEFDLDGIIVDINQLFLDITGYTRKEVLGKHHSIFVEKGYATTREYREFWNRLKKGEFQAGEFKRVTKNGDHIWLRGNYNPLMDASGKPTRVLKLATDITLAKKQQMEIDAITAAIYKSNLAVEFALDGTILKANSNFLDLLGYSAGEVIGKHHSIFVEKGYERSPEYAAFWESLRNGEYQQGEYKRITKDGESVWIRGNYNPIFDAGGKPYKILKLAADVTLARIQAQELAAQTEELETQQEELRQINEEMLEKNILLENSQTELRAQQDQLQQTNTDLEEKAGLLEEQKERLETAKLEVETKARELELTSKYKSEFLANMSHELRTPLNSILILAQLLGENKSGNLGEKEIEHAKNIRTSGTDLLSLINEILDLSKVEAGKMELEIGPVDPGELEKRMRAMFAPIAAERGIGFDLLLEEGLSGHTLFTDSQRLEQILRNLLSNAFKFTGKNGKVRLDIGMTYSPAAPGAHEPAAGINFSVTDTGIGIPQNKRDIIFEAFQQADGSTKRKYGGTGLGLSISRELAHALGGAITVQSEEGKGSSFTLHLPLAFDASRSETAPAFTTPNKAASPAVIPESPAPATPAAGPGKGTTASRGSSPPPPPQTSLHDDRESILDNDRLVLIIEDDPEFARILLDFSHERGCKGIVAHQGNAGLSLARYYKPDAIILDMKLPVLDGADVLRQLKNDPGLRHIPVQVLSGYDRAMEGLELGALDFIKKPVSTDDLRGIFTRMEEFTKRKVRKLLIVEDNKLQNQAIRELIGNNDVNSFSSFTGQEALTLMKEEDFDCIIIDLGLPDMSGFELLEKMRDSGRLRRTPIIVYTGRDLSKEESRRLDKLASTVVLKTADSRERLLDETTLFLHRMESRLPREKQQIIRKLHRTDEVLRGKKVLVVDDDMRNIYSLTNVLEEEGMHCATAENGASAVKTFAGNADFDIILMDVMMPEMDGYEAAREIRKSPKGARIPVIALTAKAMKGDREKCLDAGMSDYIAKPINIDQLLSLMRVWLYH